MSVTASNASASDGIYSIGAVSRLTGISTHTLRIWERRYQTVVAERTDTGRRVYSRRDVEKLSLLKLLVDHGFSIGQITGLSLEDLRQRREEVAGHVSTMRDIAGSAPLKVAALTGFSLDRLRHVSPPPKIELVVVENEYNRYRADVKRTRPEVLLLEFPVVNRDTIRRIGDLRAISDAQRIVVLFNFAQRADIAELAASQVELIRSPITTQNLIDTLRSGGTVAQPVSRDLARSPDEEPALGILNEEIPPRRFSEAELARLSEVPTQIECECPHNLAELIQNLTAFEVYSEHCESRNDNDAALHRYLHGTTARARSLMEEALHTLVTEEELLK